MPTPTHPLAALALALTSCAGLSASSTAPSTPDAAGAERNLARYFGFDAPRFIVVDPGFGPVAVGDFNADGRLDLAIVNNRKSRIEVHLQRAASRVDEPSPTRTGARASNVNELTPSEWFDRVDIALRQRVTAIVAHDVDRDGRTDILYAADGSELVAMRQTEAGRFDELSRTRVPGLSATRDGLKLADVMGPAGSGPELVTLVNGRIRVYPINERARLGEHLELGASDGARDQIVALYCADFTGNGLTDIIGVSPDSSTPIRLWAQESSPYDTADASGQRRGRRPGAELRFESPPLRDAQPVAFPNRAASSLAVIERTTNRVAIYDFVEQTIEPPAPSEGRVSERDVQADILPLPGGGGADRSRSVVVADLTGNGMTDLLAADASGNAMLLFAQKRGVPLREPERFSAFKSPKALAAGRWHNPGASGPLDVFVLSEEEKTVGVSRFENGRLTFPQPISLKTAGATPQAAAFVDLGAKDSPRPALAVVVELRREVFLEIHEPDASQRAPRAVKLDGVRRAPSAILSADVDQDGSVDLLLMTPGEPMVMVQGAASDDQDALRVLTDRLMPQFGLVQAAGPDNTAHFDIDGDGADELLIADANFIRAAKFDPASGWRVVEQVTDPETRGRFTGLTLLTEGSGARLVAADRAARRLVVFEKHNDAWRVADRMRLAGVEPASIFAGSFSGDAQPNLLALSGEAMGIVRFGGTRIVANAVAGFRADSDRRIDHDLEAGDINSDGFTDLVVLDAGQKMCTILTFSSRRDLLFATEFEVFQSRLFEAEQQRDLQPAQSIIADLTGDGADDLILLVHDRVVIYPQSTKPPVSP